MKIYIFYLIIENDKINEYPGAILDTIFCKGNNTYCMYAYTNDKKLYKIFKSQRNMNKFFIKNINLTEEEWYKMRYDYPEQLLFYHTLKTQKIEDDTYRLEFINVLLTPAESDNIECYEDHLFLSEIEDSLINTELQNCIENSLFNNELLNILSSSYYVLDTIDLMKGENADPESFIYNIYDELSFFIKLFKNILKEEE